MDQPPPRLVVEVADRSRPHGTRRRDHAIKLAEFTDGKFNSARDIVTVTGITRDGETTLPDLIGDGADGFTSPRHHDGVAPLRNDRGGRRRTDSRSAASYQNCLTVQHAALRLQAPYRNNIQTGHSRIMVPVPLQFARKS